MNWLVEFIFPRRLHRLSFFVRAVFCDILTPFLFMINPETNPRYFWGFDIALVVYSLFFIALPRIRDLKMSGWWLLVFIIPVINVPLLIILLFRAPNFRSGAYSVETEDE
jgi:uncharacterized membrane protein YhaH (DUF805 family)